MRYESFYPFSQGQIQASEQPFTSPQNQFYGNPNPFPYGQRNSGAPMPNQFPFGLGNSGAQNQLPFGRGRRGVPNQGPFGFMSGLGGAPNQSAQFGGGGLQSRMEQYLQTADRFLSTAQQLTPMVNKVAPMVQNLPALWKIYRGFQGMPNAGTAANTVNPNTTSPLPSGSSQPRIFQPPI